MDTVALDVHDFGMAWVSTYGSMCAQTCVQACVTGPEDCDNGHDEGRGMGFGIWPCIVMAIYSYGSI